ncbi:MAG: hypothetical protein GXZ07_05360 [Firmicutes bacterium]|jgi:stage II sporulation protein P|nr:hypothetical protein [Bacillota bacterium]
MKGLKKAPLTVLIIFFLAMPTIFNCGGNVLKAQNYREEMGELKGGFFTMKNMENGETIMRTARIINTGDEYIDSENDLYRVINIEGNIAWARHVEKIKLNQVSPSQWFKDTFQWKGAAAERQQEQVKPPLIGVYHSHGAESYVPSDGADSIPEGGGILDVGASFVKALEEHGLKVVHNEETHVPHDAGAYYRSRRTVEELLAEGVDVFFDIHRDAVPAEEYLAKVDNEEMVQLQFVVGKQNQNLEINRSYAESLKSLTDDIYPKLVKGIFLARGNYNQDMTPLSLLVEVGSHENTKEGAAESMTLFADAVATYYLGPQGRQAQEGAGGTALRSVLWLVLIAGLVLGVYLLISTENTEELRARISRFFQREFAELGRGIKQRDDHGKGGENE